MIHKVKQPRIDGANVSLILGHFQKCLTGNVQGLSSICIETPRVFVKITIHR